MGIYILWSCCSTQQLPVQYCIDYEICQAPGHGRIVVKPIYIKRFMQILLNISGPDEVGPQRFFLQSFFHQRIAIHIVDLTTEFEPD